MTVAVQPFLPYQLSNLSQTNDSPLASNLSCANDCSNTCANDCSNDRADDRSNDHVNDPSCTNDPSHANDHTNNPSCPKLICLDELMP
jgi:hypothetical protein